MQNIKRKYKAGSYKRLSREDALALANSKNESNSISNQRDLICRFVQSHQEIEIVKEYADDGFSGINFERPGFIQMMEDIKEGIIDCIIVKDLSRFGRNYIEVGKYLEEIFPLMGIRFIAIGENYDSISSNKGNDQLVIPFMNLVNDAYCRDISVKVRTSLEMKQQKGEYVGSFAPFGYQKDPANIHHFIVDKDAAEVVKRIFKLTLDGMSCGNIAALLEKEGVPSPTYYKQINGEKFGSGFQKDSKASWSPLAVRRILLNRVYIGILEQGKTYSINYKVKQRRMRDASDWYCVEDAHEPIVSRETFELVQKLLGTDFRTSPKKKTVYLFSGILVCSKCGETMIRRKKSVKGNEYVYYGCYDKNKKLRCKHISIREDQVEQAVLAILRQHIATVIKTTDLLSESQNIPYQKREVKTIDRQIEVIDKELEKYRNLKLRLYEDYHDKFISKIEYVQFDEIYEKKAERAKSNRAELLFRKEQFLKGNTCNQLWVKKFAENRNIESLDRKLLLTLTDRIVVYPENEIEVIFRYKNEFALASDVLEEYRNEEVEMPTHG